MTHERAASLIEDCHQLAPAGDKTTTMLNGVSIWPVVRAAMAYARMWETTQADTPTPAEIEAALSVDICARSQEQDAIVTAAARAYLARQAQAGGGEDDLRQAKDGAYHERNLVVAALAKLFPSGIARTDIPGWEPEWHGCVYIDLPTGQVSWHYHDREAALFDGLPRYTGEWDGHDTPEKYRRLAALTASPAAQAMGEPLIRNDPDNYKTIGMAQEERRQERIAALARQAQAGDGAVKAARAEAYENGWSDGYAESHAHARILGEVAEAILSLSASPAAPEEIKQLRADAARYRYLRDHCSVSYPMSCDQPAERSIQWEWQQSKPIDACVSIDRLIDRDIARQAELDAEDDEPSRSPTP